MHNWREQLQAVIGPGLLAGITFGDWLCLLRANGFRVHPLFVPRAALITWYAVLNSLARWHESRAHGPALRGVAVPPPLFVLGHWRSGTTLLHELLAVDRRFAFPNLYQVLYPHTFLTTEKSASAFLRLLMPKRRPQDNMLMDPAAAWEDEFAMCVSGFRTPYLSCSFPRRADDYDRFLTFRDCTHDELEQWKAAFRRFLEKVTHKHGGRALVLKSPTHTCRVRLLLEMFPQAKFVHIRRHPYAVYQSSLHLYRKALPMIRLQRTDGVDWEARILRQYRQMYDAYFEERGLIPAGHLHEVAFEEMEKDPVGQVRTLYEALGLPDFAGVEADLRRYVESIADYQKN